MGHLDGLKWGYDVLKKLDFITFQAVSFLKEDTDGKLVDAVVFGKDQISSATAVELTFKDASITAPMVEEGYLRKKTTALTDHLNLKGPRNVPSFDEKPVLQRYGIHFFDLCFEVF
jgi:hypothetical protein